METIEEATDQNSFLLSRDTHVPFSGGSRGTHGMPLNTALDAMGGGALLLPQSCLEAVVVLLSGKTMIN